MPFDSFGRARWHSKCRTGCIAAPAAICWLNAINNFVHASGVYIVGS